MQVGRILAERYEILRPLASGAMSTVWVAFDKTSGVEVAVKAISLDAAGWRTEVRDRFMKEARLLARGKHEHLVGVRDVGETEDGFLFLVLDLLDGETLAERLARETKLKWREALTLTIGIARGVAALHRSGIVHRDLKPANVVLHRAESGIVPTIIDLGIGKISGIVGDPQLCATLTATGQVLGTPQYMSYEQALGQTDIDARTDVWALGVILYEMLTGTRPFEAPNTNAVLAAIRRHNVRPIHDTTPDVPVAITRIVERCLSTNRSERVVDAEALSKMFEAALDDPLVYLDEHPLPLAQPVQHPPRRRLVVAVVSTAITVSLLAFAFTRMRNAPSPVVTEIVVRNEASSTLAAPVIGVATNATSTPPASDPPSQHVDAAPAQATPTTSAPTRNRVPISRVDEAGF